MSKNRSILVNPNSIPKPVPEERLRYVLESIAKSPKFNIGTFHAEKRVGKNEGALVKKLYKSIYKNRNRQRYESIWMSKFTSKNPLTQNFNDFVFCNIYKYLVWHGVPKARINITNNEMSFCSQFLPDFHSADRIYSSRLLDLNSFNSYIIQAYAAAHLIADNDLNDNNYGICLYSSKREEKIYIPARIDFGLAGCFTKNTYVLKYTDESGKINRISILSDNLFDFNFQLTQPPLNYSNSQLPILISKEFARESETLCQLNLAHIHIIIDHSLRLYLRLIEETYKADEDTMKKVMEKISSHYNPEITGEVNAEYIVEKIISGIKKQISEMQKWVLMIEAINQSDFKPKNIETALNSIFPPEEQDSHTLSLIRTFKQIYNYIQINILDSKPVECSAAAGDAAHEDKSEATECSSLAKMTEEHTTCGAGAGSAAATTPHEEKHKTTEHSSLPKMTEEAITCGAGAATNQDKYKTEAESVVEELSSHRHIVEDPLNYKPIFSPLKTALNAVGHSPYFDFMAEHHLSEPAKKWQTKIVNESNSSIRTSNLSLG
jgi:hypothetical protein